MSKSFKLTLVIIGAVAMLLVLFYAAHAVGERRADEQAAATAAVCAEITADRAAQAKSVASVQAEIDRISRLETHYFWLEDKIMERDGFELYRALHTKTSHRYVLEIPCGTIVPRVAGGDQNRAYTGKVDDCGVSTFSVVVDETTNGTPIMDTKKFRVYRAYP